MAELTLEQQTEKIINWCREEFSLPDYITIDVLETKTDDNAAHHKTDIIFKPGAGNPVTYSILKSIPEINREDIVFLKESLQNYAEKKYPLRSKLYKFFGWWAIFASAITAFSVCPVCGQTGCPVGIGTAGILAGFLSLLKMNTKNFITFMKNIFSNKTNHK